MSHSWWHFLMYALSPTTNWSFSDSFSFKGFIFVFVVVYAAVP